MGTDETPLPYLVAGLVAGLVARASALLFGVLAIIYADTYRRIETGSGELMLYLYDLERLCYLDLALLAWCLVPGVVVVVCGGGRETNDFPW